MFKENSHYVSACLLTTSTRCLNRSSPLHASVKAYKFKNNIFNLQISTP